MRAIIYKLTFFICVGLFLTACRPASAPRIVSSGNRSPQANRPEQPAAPPVDVQKLGWKLKSGAKQTLTDYRGKVVVLDFWATYCPPCLEEIPHLVYLQSKHNDEGLRIIGLHVGGDDDRPYVPDFVRKLKIQYDLGYPEPELVDALFNGTDVIPQTFVFDRSGKLVRGVSGYSAQVREELDEAVQQALAN
jgi:thiol-disulfide isomerase/thioredoxin